MTTEEELLDIIHSYFKKINKERQIRIPPHELIIKPELPPDVKNRDRIVMIKAGNPPIVFLSRLYIEISLINNTIQPLTKTLESIIRFIPRMRHTLSVIPIAEAIAMRKDSKKWFRASIPNFRLLLDDRDLEYSYSVTVMDKITGTSITRNGNNIEELKERTKKEISNMIISSEEMDDYRESMKDVEFCKTKEVLPSSVDIIVMENKTETIMDY